MNNTVYNFNGAKITFSSSGDEVSINATEMAKPFGKYTKDYLKTQSAQEYIQAISVRRKCLTSDLVKVIQGGSYQGTWMHEDVALDFAQWLSVDFKLWCNDRIKELMKYGFTATEKTLDDLIGNPDLLIGLATQLKEERLEKERLILVADKQSKELVIQAPKVQYYNEVLTSSSTYKTTHIAAELGMSAVKLNQMLHELRIQYKQNDTWVLYSKHQGKGYTKTSTYTYTSTTGETKTSMQTEWTEEGRKFIHGLLKPQNTQN